MHCFKVLEPYFSCFQNTFLKIQALHVAKMSILSFLSHFWLRKWLSKLKKRVFGALFPHLTFPSQMETLSTHLLSDWLTPFLRLHWSDSRCLSKMPKTKLKDLEKSDNKLVTTNNLKLILILILLRFSFLTSMGAVFKTMFLIHPSKWSQNSLIVLCCWDLVLQAGPITVWGTNSNARYPNIMFYLTTFAKDPGVLWRRLLGGRFNHSVRKQRVPTGRRAHHKVSAWCPCLSCKHNSTSSFNVICSTYRWYVCVWQLNRKKKQNVLMYLCISTLNSKSKKSKSICASNFVYLCLFIKYAQFAHAHLDISGRIL